MKLIEGNALWRDELRASIALYAEYVTLVDKLIPILQKQDGKRLSKHIENAINKWLSAQNIEVRLYQKFSWWELSVLGTDVPKNFPTLTLAYNTSPNFDFENFAKRELGRFKLWLQRAQDDYNHALEMEGLIDDMVFKLSLIKQGMHEIKVRQGPYGSILSAVFKERS